MSTTFGNTSGTARSHTKAGALTALAAGVAVLIGSAASTSASAHAAAAAAASTCGQLAAEIAHDQWLLRQPGTSSSIKISLIRDIRDLQEQERALGCPVT